MKEPMSEAGLGWLLDHHGHGEGREGEGVAGGWEETQGFLSEGLVVFLKMRQLTS